MNIKKINTNGLGSILSSKVIKSYEILQSKGKAKIEDNINIKSHIINMLTELRIINYNFVIKDIVRLSIKESYCYFIYIDITVPYYYNPGSLDVTHEVDQCVVLGYAKLGQAYDGFIVKPKTGVDKIRTSFNKIFGNGLFKSNKNDNLFHDNYLVQGNKAAFERFSSDEIKKDMLKLKELNLFVKKDILIAGMIEDFKVENVIELSNFFKTIQSHLYKEGDIPNESWH